VYEAGVVISSI